MENNSEMRLSRYADLIPLAAFVLVVGIVFLFDRERAAHPERDLSAAHSAAERRAGVLADEMGNEVSALLGALSTARVAFAAVTDEASQAAFMESLDTLTARSNGLTGVSLVYVATEEIVRVPGTGLGQRIGLGNPDLRNAYLRAVGSQRPAATQVVNYGIGPRVFVFDPLVATDAGSVGAVLVAELNPQGIYQAITNEVLVDTVVGGGVHQLFGPGNVRLSSLQPAPPGWGRVSRDVRVADTAWRVEVAYAPPDLRAYRAERIATWIAGLAIALAFAVILHFLRRTIRTQKEEIARRQAAEEAARLAADDARDRAREARELAAQLSAAQLASQRLSTSLDPDDVVEQFLGGVAEILDADVASIYTFDEEGELLAGRRRIIFREVEGITERLRQDDIRAVSAPVAMLPTLGQAVSTGEPYVVESTRREDGSGGRGAEQAASVTVPLLIAGHTVGVATWEVFARPRRFPPTLVAFAQALGAPAAAALHTAELFATLESERRRTAQEALRFGAVLDQMADGVIVVDADGALERSNAAAEELLGGELGSVRVAEWPERFGLVSPDGRPLTSAEFPLARAMRGERVRRATFIIRSDWGTERHVSCSAGPIRSQSGAPGGAAMVLRDVSDEHQYAEMLRHTNRELRRQADMLEQVNQQLREATRAKDQFMAVMSHELRTPINAIMGYSDLLDLGVKGPLNDDQRAMLARVRDTSRHLLGLINEVLDLAKIGAGRMDLVLAEQDVTRVVDRAAQQILPLASARGLRLTVEQPADGGAVVARADETRLTQVMVNLMSNAAKFTTVGGITVSYGSAEGYVLIHVADTGPGIPPDQVEQIFEEFYQVEGGLSRSSGGTGLGLSISRRFARLMGGDITVESVQGDGSVFTVRLPGADPSQAASDDGDARVLVLGHARAALDRLSSEVNGSVRLIGATEPGELAGLVRRDRPGVVAIDVQAPHQAAWRAVAALQSDPESSTLPVQLFAHCDDDAEHALDFGQVTFLGKPISVERATRLIRQGPGAEGPPRVVVADGDPHVRSILAEGLSAAGCEVVTAGSGSELLAVARDVRPHIVLLDLLMSGIDGLEVLAVLRTEPELAEARVVVLMNREIPPEEMTRLDSAARGVVRNRHGAASSTAELVRRAAQVAGADERRSGALT